MGEHSVDEGVSGPVAEMVKDARAMQAKAATAASVFETKYEFWLNN
jgi:hypothetical protein